MELENDEREEELIMLEAIYPELVRHATGKYLIYYFIPN
jgi:hypothetical protein